MKGFYINVTNNLLDPKHREKMGIALWLYIFLLDKMTSVDEKGVGTILGGRPIKFEEVNAELGISKNTYTRWIDDLVSYPYITAKTAPYGIIFTILKAKKGRLDRFTKNGEAQGIEVHQKKKEVHHKSKEVHHKRGRGSPKVGNVIKTVQDITKDITIDTATDAASGKEINDLIDLFKDVNPSVNQLFKNTSQRASIERLLKNHGHKQLEWVIKSLKISNKHQYAPTITKPSELEYKIGALIAFWQKEKAKQQKNKIISIQNKKP